MKITLKDFIPQREMQFQPVEDDDDELSQAIRGDTRRQDDQWDLTDELDSAKLAAFWDDAIKDLGERQPNVEQE